MGLAVCLAAALAALQDEVPTVQLPPQPETQAVEKPRVVVPPAAAENPRRITESPVEGPSLAGFVVASFGVVGLLGLGVFLLRKYGKNARFLGGSGPIRVLGRRSLGARQEVLLLEVGTRVLVVGSTREGLAPLGEITNPDEVAVLRAEAPGRREDSQRSAFKDTLKEGLKGAAPAPAPTEVYASIADELAEIKKTVHAWKA